MIYRCVQYNIYDLIQSTPHQHRSSSISHAAALSNPFMPMPLSPEASAPATSLPGGACRASPGLLNPAAVTPALGPGRRAPGTTPPTHALPCSGLACVATCHAAGEASEWGAQAGRARAAAGGGRTRSLVMSADSGLLGIKACIPGALECQGEGSLSSPLLSSTGGLCVERGE